MPLAANGGEGSLLLEAHRGEDLRGYSERILTLAAQPSELAGLVAALANVEFPADAAERLRQMHPADQNLGVGDL